MIYPDQSMPVSFNWDNFTSALSYNFSNGISSYNASTKTLKKQFNITLSMPKVSGYINYSNFGGVWDEFNVIAYLLEPGNMVHTDYGDLPFNLSAFNNNGATNNVTDFTNLSSGFYNISLPATVESSTIILFATARNGSRYYGGFRNISLSYNDYAAGGELNNFNFSWMSGLLGTNGSATTNISMDKAAQGNPDYINISTAKQIFNLINKKKLKK